MGDKSSVCACAEEDPVESRKQSWGAGGVPEMASGTKKGGGGSEPDTLFPVSGGV